MIYWTSNNASPLHGQNRVHIISTYCFVAMGLSLSRHFANATCMCKICPDKKERNGSDTYKVQYIKHQNRSATRCIWNQHMPDPQKQRTWICTCSLKQENTIGTPVSLARTTCELLFLHGISIRLPTATKRPCNGSIWHALWDHHDTHR